LVNTLTVIGISVGLAWGALGVALAISVVQCAVRIPSILYCFKGTPLRLRDVMAAVWRPAWVSLAAGIGGYVVSVLIGPAFDAWHPVARLGCQLASFATILPLAWILTPGGWTSLKEIIALSRELRSGRKFS
ncbi:MAG: hypothetical protein ACR2RL_10655, partial [Gammaproteobacteria bacterium]